MLGRMMFGYGSYLPSLNQEGNQGFSFEGMYSDWDSNAYSVTCDLCSGFHFTYECMQAQNLGYNDECKHYNGRYNSHDLGCADNDSSCFYEYQPNCVQFESKPSWELAIEKLANTPSLLEDANDSKPPWELAIEKLANTTSNSFDRIEKKIDVLASHLEGILGQMHNLCEAISCGYLQIDPNNNERNVACEDGLYFDENDESNLCFNDEVSILHDDVFGMNFDPQEEGINDSFLTLLEECFTSVSSNDIFPQRTHKDFPLVNSQAVLIKVNFLEMLEIKKPLSSLISFEDKAQELEPPFTDPPRPKKVDHSLRKPP